MTSELDYYNNQKLLILHSIWNEFQGIEMKTEEKIVIFVVFSNWMWCSVEGVFAVKNEIFVQKQVSKNNKGKAALCIERVNN